MKLHLRCSDFIATVQKWFSISLIPWLFSHQELNVHCCFMKTWFRLSVSRFIDGLCLTLCCRTVTTVNKIEIFSEKAKSGHGLPYTLIQQVFKQLHSAWGNEGKRVSLEILNHHDAKQLQVMRSWAKIQRSPKYEIQQKWQISTIF